MSHTQSRPITVQETNRKLQELRHQLEEQLRQLQAEGNAAAAQAAIEATEWQMKELERRLEQAIANSRDALEREQCRRLKEQAERYDKELKSVKGQVSDVAKAIDKIDKKFTKEVNALGKSVSSLEKTVDSILAEFRNNEKRSSELAELARTFLKSVMRRTPVERFTPDTLKVITQDLQALADSKLPAQANIAVAHQILQRISHMEEDAQRAQLRHEAILASAKKILATNEEFVKEHSSVPVTVDGKTGQVPVDFWTKGQYEAIKKRLEIIREMLEKDKNQEGEYLTDADLEKIINEDLEQISRSAGNCVSETVTLATQSMDRIKVARQLVTTLKKSGWDVEIQDGSQAFDFLGSEQHSGDMREGIFAIMRKKNTGEVLTITIVPGADGNPEMIFQNNVEDANPATKQQLDDNIASIMEHLAKAGYDTGGATESRCVSEQPLQELGSAKALKGKGSAEAIRGRLGK